jgi:UDP-N-acetylmuramate dehydrogenase
LSNLTQNIPLDDLNTFRVSAVAKHFIQIDSVEQLLLHSKEIQSYADRLVLGGGSNCLFVDDFLGLVIYPQLKGITLVKESEESVTLQVAASENWHEFVCYCLEHDYFGLENLALIPGTVGAAPVQNIGAYGVEVESFIKSIDCFDFELGKMVTLSHVECEFAYRDSLIKRSGQGRFLVTSVEFVLSKKINPEISYAPLKEKLSDCHEITAQQIFERVCELRQQKLPNPSDLANAGSFFKNPVISEKQLNQLKQTYPKIIAFPASPQKYKVAAGWLIETAGFKGQTFDKVGVHKYQALVIVNYSDTNGKNILNLANAIMAKIAEQFGIMLEPEVRILGGAPNKS